MYTNHQRGTHTRHTNETYKRDILQRHTKEANKETYTPDTQKRQIKRLIHQTHKRDLQKRPTKET